MHAAVVTVATGFATRRVAPCWSVRALVLLLLLLLFLPAVWSHVGMHTHTLLMLLFTNAEERQAVEIGMTKCDVAPALPCLVVDCSFEPRPMFVVVR